MAVFKINEEVVKKIPSVKIGLEKNIQNIFEHNLNEILDINFLASEYSTSFGGRIDTLGIDNNGSPVIIEYKKGQNNSVINQALSYLKWLLDHKADFHELMLSNKIEIDVDWNSPRVICIAESYNKFDLDTVDILPIKIELYKYKIYEDGILVVDSEVSEKVKISISHVITKNETTEKKDRINYSIEDHLEIATEKNRRLFEELKEKIRALDESIIEDVKAKYIAYKLITNFVDVVIQKDSLKLFLNIESGVLDDPISLARDLTKPKKVGHWGNGDYEVRVNANTNLDEVFKLIEQSYNYNK